MKYNYHTHTALCHHAVGTNEEYVLAAIKAGFDEIGFADHSPWDFKDYVSNMRMAKEDLPAYCESIKALREKYKDKIKLIPVQYVGQMIKALGLRPANAPPTFGAKMDE